jgi:hypothetical protein
MIIFGVVHSAVHPICQRKRASTAAAAAAAAPLE